jgi:flagellar biosynthetic protein FliP
MVLLCAAAPAAGQNRAAPARGAIDSGAFSVPDVTNVLPNATDREGVSATLQIFILLTVLSLVPSILIMMTSFTRITIVLALIRQAMGTQQLPPGQVLAGLALFLTFLVMAPTWQVIHVEAVTPWLDNAPGMTQERALEIAGTHLSNFMFDQIETAGNAEDVYLFYEYAQRKPVPAGETISRAEVPMRALIPAFIVSELKIAFVMGFRLYLPFLVIDMTIASILISMGMMMLPPVLISLPFKLLLFVLADGWHLVVGALLSSFVV